MLILLSATAAAAQSADVQVTKSPYDIGYSDFTYQIRVANIGPNDAIDTVVMDPIPAHTTFTSITATPGWMVSTPAVGAGGTITLTRATFPQGGLTEFLVTVTVVPGTAGGTSIVNTATIASDTPDPTPGNNSATVSRFLEPYASVGVEIQSGSSIVRPSPGEEFVYTIEVFNLIIYATDITATVTLPAHTTFLSFIPSPGWVMTTPPVGGTGPVTLTRAAVSGERYDFTLRVRVDPDTLPGTDITATVSATSTLVDPNLNDNTASNTKRVQGPTPKISVSDVTIAEGHAGTTNAVFTISADTPYGQPISVRYETADDTAVAGSDYTATTGVATLAIGDSSTTFQVPILGDTDVEPAQTFLVNLTPLTNAQLADGQGTGTITNDDGPTTYYFAEGATGGFFDLEIALGNPDVTSAEAELTFLVEGSAPIVVTRTLPPQSRTSVHVDEIPGLGSVAGVSTIVRGTTGHALLVDRLMRWDDATGYGGHAQRASVSPATRWLFAEGVQNGSAPQSGGQPFFDTFLLLANADATAATATVRFLLEPVGVVTKSYALAPHSRFTIYCGGIPELVGRSFSMDVTATAPILAERSSYFGAARLWDGGHSSSGVNAAATSWFHAEGATGPYFETFLTMANPGTAAAQVSLAFLLLDGQEVVKQKTIPGGARLTVNIEQEDAALSNAAVSTQVTSDQPIVSERVTYWPDPFSTWHEAHSTPGATSSGLRWGVAEGRVGLPANFNTYLLLANPNAAAAEVRVTFLRTSGAPVTKLVTVPPRSRFNLHVNGQVPELANEVFSTEITATNNQPILVEEALYWDALGVTWAGGAAIPAAKLP